MRPTYFSAGCHSSPPGAVISHFAILHYDGTGFNGWQRQKTERTVQAEFEAALARLNDERTRCTAAGRTDTGVHALGQVVSFALHRPWEPDTLAAALNANTPPDIWVDRAGGAPDGFDARRHAVSRRYRYVVGCDRAATSPFRRPYEWALGRPLDASLLQEGAAVFRGEHDFRAYAAVGQPKPHYRCNVTHAEWRAREGGEGFIFTVEANRFLHRMVRFMVGGMVEVARGRRAPEDLARLLTARDNRAASPPAPPQGLYFVSVRYPHPLAGDAA